jgi:hypothetical protein
MLGLHPMFFMPSTSRLSESIAAQREYRHRLSTSFFVSLIAIARRYRFDGLCTKQCTVQWYHCRTASWEASSKHSSTSADCRQDMPRYCSAVQCSAVQCDLQPNDRIQFGFYSRTKTSQVLMSSVNRMGMFLTLKQKSTTLCVIICLYSCTLTTKNVVTRYT